jgi:hypothetical protein
MRQEYFLGEVLRNRYVEELELIHPNYTRVQVYVRSTDYDRTLMSAESVLAALFPPKGDQVWYCIAWPLCINECLLFLVRLYLLPFPSFIFFSVLHCYSHLHKCFGHLN